MQKPSFPLTLFSAMIYVAATFFVMIKLVFLIAYVPSPEMIADTTLTALSMLILLAGIALLIKRIISSGEWTRAKIRRESDASAAQYREERRLRVEELLSDPARAKYAPLVERGEIWSEENIAYNEAPDLTETCLHLRAIERAMRCEGVEVKRYAEGAVSAKCRIDYEALEHDFTVASHLHYAEFFAGDRTEYERPMAYLVCDEHKSTIHTVHPESGSMKDIPLFPHTQA